MIEIIWEFVVKEQDRGKFELVYGPGGAWSNLFAGCQGFRGTTVMRDTKIPRRYLTIDIWDTETQLDRALVERQAEYTDLKITLGHWTESAIELGTFSIQAQANVRPRGKVGQTRRGRGRRRQ